MMSAPRTTPADPAIAPAPPETLRTRNFGLFFVARAAARLGDMMAPVALAAGLIAHGHGAGAVGAAMASMTATFAALVIFGGVFADRFDARTVMIGADLARIGTQAGIAALFLTGHVVLWQICLLSAGAGVGAAMFQPGVASTIPRIAADVQGANGAIRTAESAMTLAGPAAAGALVGLTSAGGVFLVHAATYAVSALCLALLRLPTRPRDDAPAPDDTRERLAAFRADLAEGWREFASRTWMWGVIVVWMAFMVTSWGPTVPLVATEVVREHGAGTYGLINSVMGAGMVLGGLLAMRLRPLRPLRAGATALLGFGAQPVAVGLDAPVPAIAGAMAVSGAAMAFWSVMWATSIQTQVPSGALSRVHSYEVAGSISMQPVGHGLAGPAAGAFGASEVLVAGGAAALLSATALLSVPAIRNLVRVDRRPAGAGSAVRKKR